MSGPLDRLLATLADGPPQPVYLVAGDRVLAEPAAVSLARALAERAGCEPEVHRRPPALGPLLADLKTFSLFGSAKVTVAVETAVVADQQAAADLIDEAAEALPIAEQSELSLRERRAAARLLQTLHLFQLDPVSAASADVLERLPDWALQGGSAYRRKHKRRPRGKRQVADLREQLVALLDAARAAEIEGHAEGELMELADVVERGLPEGHTLVLAESAVAGKHPLVVNLAERGALVEVGRVESTRRGGWSGLELLAEELERESGVAIRRDALEELARRTLQQGGRSAGGAVEADSSARFAAEYRKLAMTAEGGEIGRQLVEEVVEDRGQEDVWKILDAVGAGRGDEALQRLSRLVAASEDPTATRFSFFSLLAGFARQLTAIDGMLALGGAPRGERNYNRFKERIAPRLQGELEEGRKSPLAGLHPYRLHRAYLTACRMPAGSLVGLPRRVLETELRMKGESGKPEAALAELLVEIAAAARAS